MVIEALVNAGLWSLRNGMGSPVRYTRWFALSAAVLGSCPCWSPVVSGQRPVVVFEAPIRIDGGATFARILSGGLASDGRFCIGDDLDSRVSCFSPEGRFLWARGRAGEGPGEYRLLYRVAVAPSGSVFAYDAAKTSVSRYSRDGELQGQLRLPMFFAQVTSMVAVDDSTIALAGAPSSAGMASDSAIHLFSVRDTLLHLKSFGLLPKGIDDIKQRMFGAGLLTVGNGILYYSRRVPYEIRSYDHRGTAIHQVSIATPVATPVEELFVVQKLATRTRFGFTPPQTNWHRISTVRVLDRHLAVVLRVEGTDHQVMDLLALPTLERVGTVDAPQLPPGMSIVGVDQARSRMVVATSCDDEPCVMAVPFQIK